MLLGQNSHIGLLAGYLTKNSNEFINEKTNMKLFLNMIIFRRFGDHSLNYQEK